MNDLNNKFNSLKEELNKSNERVDGVYCCSHGREDNCKCKKPKIGMIIRAKKDFNINLTESYVIGDMGISDMVMAKKR